MSIFLRHAIDVVECMVFKVQMLFAPKKVLDALTVIPKGDRFIIEPVEIIVSTQSSPDKVTPSDVPQFRSGLPWGTDDVYDDSNVRVDDNLLMLTYPKTGLTSALLYSNFTFKYGTVRALIKLPKVKGVWSAFWLFEENGLPEHDILEHCGSWKHKVNVTHHWGNDYDGKFGKRSTNSNGRKSIRFAPTDGFNLYEVEKTPYKTTYKINGHIVRTMKTGVSSGDSHVIFNVTTGDYCKSDKLQTVEEDAVMEIKLIELFVTHK